VEVLREFLPDSYPEAIESLLSICDSFSGMTALIFPDFVSRYGLNHWKLSINALQVFTPLCSSEFGIRPFIEKNPDKAFKQLRHWTKHKDEHVRRLASEGCRILLPWAPRVAALNNRQNEILGILDVLKTDPSLYVRRSVANSLNDISKLDTNLAIETAREWKGISEETDWVVKHAMRGLLKKGIPEVLKIFGYSNPKSLGAVKLNLQADRLKLGETLEFDIEISTRRGALGLTRLEFVIGYLKANGRLNEKVFLISDREIDSNEKSFSKRISFKDLSTRKHYAGEHTIRLAVNGKRFPPRTFELIPA